MGDRVKIDELIRTRRKTLGLTVTADARLIVRAPKRLSMAYIERFIREKTPWILNKQAQMRNRPQAAHTYADGDVFFLLGEAVELRYDASVRRVTLAGNLLLLPIKEQARAKELLEVWYRAYARSVFADRIEYYAPLMRVQPGALRVSGAKGRWGSCGAGGSINLVWRLVMAPIEAVDYVVVHELAHIKRRDHSPLFWQEVERILPAYVEQKRWLKQNARLLEL